LRTLREFETLGLLVRVPQDKLTVQALIASAVRKKSDAELTANSWDTRVEANYDACLNLALAVVNALGFKAKSAVGHHESTLEAACSAIGAGEALFDRVDAIRVIRNLKYTGMERTGGDYTQSKQACEEFTHLVVGWLQNKHAALLKR
jgi:hypothetical protein